jgi:asparagine synthase (glutamine-hydrolysing)
MCGISGVVSKTNIDIDSFKIMNQIIKHRGPDDEGFVLFSHDDYKVLGSIYSAKESFESEGKYLPKQFIENLDYEAQVAFGHRRLSILDLSPKGHQPMCSKEERYWITFNGEVYNYIEIRDELITLGYTFNSDSDTEVILSAYDAWGVECQHRFNGMWAFAIYDRKEKLIFLSRDRFGIKPLYYWISPDKSLYFGSEIKQFTVLPDWNAKLNRERAFDYLYYALTDHTDETLFEHVYSLPSGCYFEQKVEEIFTLKGKIDFVRWYTPVDNCSELSFDEARDGFLEKFKNVIKLHLRADVPIGSALSGGLDSSSIVSYINILLKEQGKSELQKTFSSCSHDERFNERKWMEEVIRETSVDGNYIYPKGEDIFSLIDKLIWHMDEPYQSQSVFLGYHVFKEASNKGVTVLLNGQGADEYLSGYSNYRIFRQKKMLKSFKIKQLKEELGSYCSIINVSKYVFQDFLPLGFRSYLSFLSKKNKRLDKVVKFKKLIKRKKHPYDTMKYKNDSLVSISRHQLLKEPLQKYLRWEDRNSMAHSVEARVPFLDHRLVEFVHSLPVEYLDNKDMSKRILVEAMDGILPEKVRNRKDKQGFITPEEMWFKSDFKNEFLNLLDENVIYAKGIIDKKEARSFLIKMQNGDIPFDYSYWHILQFCIWMKVFNVKIE